MDVDTAIGELLVLSTYNLVESIALSVVTLLVIVPYLLGIIPFYPVSVICVWIVFIFGVTSIYELMNIILRNN